MVGFAASKPGVALRSTPGYSHDATNVADGERQCGLHESAEWAGNDFLARAPLKNHLPRLFGVLGAGDCGWEWVGLRRC